MIRIAHRRNTVVELDATPQTLGVEIDIRTRNNSLIVHHDAFAEGELLESWLEHYHHGLLVLNVKEEGLEDRFRRVIFWVASALRSARQPWRARIATKASDWQKRIVA